MSAGLDQIDFISGKTHKSILIQFLESFKDLAETPFRLWETKKVINFCGSLIDNVLPFPMTILETGSVAENVCSVSRHQFSNLNATLFFSPESDIMARLKVLELNNQSPFLVKTAGGRQCYVNIVTDTGCQYNEHALPNIYYNIDDTCYLSPKLFLECVRSSFAHALQSKLTETTSYEVIEHGPAVQIRVTEKCEGLDSLDPHSAQEGRHWDETDIDVVPAVLLPDWPDVAKEWCTRYRKWPTKELVDTIISKGVMVISKAPRGGNVMTDWRLSFSEAEVTLLSTTELPCRQHAHRIFKYIVKHIIGPPSVLNSYHCKTILLWVSERLPTDFWAWERLGQCVLGLLDELIFCITTRQCPHYFIPEVNIFEDIPTDFLHTVGQKLISIRRNPIIERPWVLNTTKEQILRNIESYEAKISRASPCVMEVQRTLLKFKYI